jgi:hypothetical protein
VRELAIAISPTLRRYALETMRLAATALPPPECASDAILDAEWIEIDVSDLTLH